QKVNILILTAGGQRIELIEPASDDSPITRFVEKSEGLHHLAWEVNDLGKVLARLKKQGMRLIDEAPRNGAHNTRIAFLHPASCGGVLTDGEKSDFRTSLQRVTRDLVTGRRAPISQALAKVESLASMRKAHAADPGAPSIATVATLLEDCH
ncbi:MAG TPA: VOC family protein, partial [Planctomycetes bacterium]|nr:VOC family protein [Planctomycetota bacterium]